MRKSRQAVTVEISVGELVDKITILQIKSERIDDIDKLTNVRSEIATLLRARDDQVDASEELEALTRQLKGVNEELWHIENAIREHDLKGDFRGRFIELAQSVYRLNDKRSLLKQRINELTNSSIVEEKSYSPY